MSRKRALTAALSAIALILSLAPSVALTDTTEISVHEFNVTEVNATRAGFHLQIGQMSSGTWRLEYTTEPANPASWTLARSGSLVGQMPAFAEILDLVPQTHYHARLVAENSLDKAENTAEFTTTVVAPPVFFPTHDPAHPGGLTGPECSNPHPSGGVGPFCDREGTTPTTGPGALATDIYANGANTNYHFEYSTSKSAVESGSGTLILSAIGSLTAAEELKEVELERLEGLAPETTYYLRGVAENEASPPTATIFSFTTQTARATVAFDASGIHPTATSAYLLGNVHPNGFETHWGFEYAPAETDGSAPAENSPAWATGLAGTLAGAEAAYTEGGLTVEGTLAGLSPGFAYYVRLRAENSNGHETSLARAFHTSGPPTPTTFATHALHGEALRLLGYLEPHNAGLNEIQTVTVGGAPSGGHFTLTANGQSVIATLLFNATAQQVEGALNRLSGYSGNVRVAGPAAGPYTVEFFNHMGNLDLPPLEADSSGLTPSGTVAVATLQDGSNYATHYHFEYLTEAQFQADGESFGVGTESTPEVAFEGTDPQFLGADLPPLEPGETYRYRLTATNTTPGDPVRHGEAQRLTVPAAPQAGPEEPCANRAFRAGPSAGLPDCRAYEQVTPHDKEGAEELFHYGSGGIANSGSLIGEDGDHFEFDGQFVHWGQAGGSPYFFSRVEGQGWQMTPGTPQPEAGIDIHYVPQLYSPDLTRFAFAAGWQTESGVESPNLEFKSGPPGGPYPLAAPPVPRKQAGPNELLTGGGWVAASHAFSNLILATEDRTLIPPHNTGTSQGLDLYEYSAGQLRQANVSTGAPGTTIGSCGASVAKGRAETGGEGTSSPHSVSADGRRFFFYAVPGSNCSAAKHLYLRLDGAETTDLGALTFLAANSQGTEALLEARSGPTSEVLLYDTESHATKHLFSYPFDESAPRPLASADLGAIYLPSRRQLTAEAPPPTGESQFDYYRYDVAAETLAFAFQGRTFDSSTPVPLRISPDGRYAYIQGEVEGVPTVAAGVRADQRFQALRYDSSTGLVQCLSCASHFDPEPSHPAFFTNEQGGANSSTRNATPGEVIASANGDYVFFDTVSALVPGDVNGERPPEPCTYHAACNPEPEHVSNNFSTSSDVYEWRRPGLDGCIRPQGCLSLISSGGAGRQVMLLGAADEGRDVFFSSASQLGPNDNDGALDVYDARIGGGEAPFPTPPVECEGDACATPPAPPLDTTPTSSVFSGPGNLAPLLPPPPASAKPKPKPKPCKKHVVRKKGKCVKKQRAGRNRGGSK
jgi:hypothetical protein